MKFEMTATLSWGVKGEVKEEEIIRMMQGPEFIKDSEEQLEYDNGSEGAKIHSMVLYNDEGEEIFRRNADEI